MSKYTEWLNKQIEEDTEVDFKDFLRVCAWESIQLKKMAPETLVPVTKIDITEELQELDERVDEAENIRQEVQAYSTEKLEELVNAEYEKVNLSRISNIRKADNIIDKYGNILAQLCEFAPEDAHIQALKTFAMKELQANMPNLILYANPPKKEGIATYHARLKKESKEAYEKLAKEYTDKYDENSIANIYISTLELEIDKYDDIHSASEPKIRV